MKIEPRIHCEKFPCQDVRHECFRVPRIKLDPEKIQMVMITEAAPENPADDFYAPGTPGFMKNTLKAFHDAGFQAASVNDLLQAGIYLTTAIKCGKIGYGVSAKSIQSCSALLEKELDFFPNIQVYLLMGDVAIKGLNYIAQRKTGQKVVTAGSTYKIRHNEFFYQNHRVFPSYLQTGKNYLIEKSKQRMIAEDIANALKIIT